MSSKIHLALTLILLVFFSIQPSISQDGSTPRGFQAEIMAGLNFSQLDGDGLSGFNKLGLRGGLSLGYPLSDKRGLSLSLLYDQRGSSTGIITSSFKQFIALDYIAMPMSIYFNSWWHPSLDRHKIRVYGSLIPARLVSTRSSHADFDNATDRFKKWDISMALGIAYTMGRRGAVDLRIERSLLKIYNVPGSNVSGLQSYLISIGYRYWLNER